MRGWRGHAITAVRGVSEGRAYEGPPLSSLMPRGVRAKRHRRREREGRGDKKGRRRERERERGYRVVLTQSLVYF